MTNINSVEIKELRPEHISELVKKLSENSAEYLKLFTAFELTSDTFNSILSKAIWDKYFGIFFGETIIGFYMLRGFDQGYEVPSYGVVISSDFSNKGLSRLTLYHAFALCKLNGIKKIMLKVRPENIFAKKLYESVGFERTGFDEKNGNYIYYKTLSS